MFYSGPFKKFREEFFINFKLPNVLQNFNLSEHSEEFLNYYNKTFNKLSNKNFCSVDLLNVLQSFNLPIGFCHDNFRHSEEVRNSYIKIFNKLPNIYKDIIQDCVDVHVDNNQKYLCEAYVVALQNSDEVRNCFINIFDNYPHDCFIKVHNIGLLPCFPFTDGIICQIDYDFSTQILDYLFDFLK